jgi:glutamine synthetase
MSYGIENKLELYIPASLGLDKSGKLPGERLPKTLKEATLKMMEKGSLARLILGDAFVDHYAATRLHECREWDTAVTDWELTRYMETI